MKVTPILTLNNRAYPVLAYECSLELNACGSARFVIEAQKPILKGTCRLRIEINSERQTAFSGLIESSQKQDDNTVEVNAREILAALDKSRPVFSLRFPTLGDVARELTKATGIPLSLDPDQEPKKRPAYYAARDAAGTLRLALRSWGVPFAVLLSLRKTSLYAGNLFQSPLTQAPPLAPPNQAILGNRAGWTLLWPYPFRPGQRIRIDREERLITHAVYRDNLTKTQTINADPRRVFEALAPVARWGDETVEYLKNLAADSLNT